MRPSRRLVRLFAITLAGGVTLGVSLVALGPGIAEIAGSAQYSGRVVPRLRPLEGPTTIYDAQGNVLDRIGNLDRTPVELGEVPKVLVDAVVATEDRTFYTNPGIDVRSAVRALVENVDTGGISQGGSTITQQLVKNRFFVDPKQDLDRKLREAVLATRLTNEWSKRRILQEYLNTVYFGENAYGVNAAARRIIGRPLAELDLAQAALLAGLIKNPSAFDPFVNPGDATKRRQVVLEAMVRDRKITEDEATLAAAAPLPEKPAPVELKAHTVYTEEVKNRLLGLEELGATEQAAAQRVFGGDLRVYTAMDQRTYWQAQAAVDSTVGKFAPFTASMAVMDPRTGDVKAIVSGAGGAASTPQGFNLATMGPDNTNGRFVGSTFKPITLATAFENGYSPKDTVDGNAPCTVKFVEGTPGKPGFTAWWPIDTEPKGHTFRNASGEGGGTADLYSQTRNSVNCAFERLLTSVGPPKVREMATRLGMTRPVGKYLSIGIGDTGHSPVEMATVYSTFAADGVRHDPVFIKRVEDAAGRVLYRAPSGRRVLDQNVARTVTDVLSHVTEGTAPRAKLADRPMAGKTGTRDNSEDAWFAGYTPQLVAVVWMGDPASSQHAMTNVGGVRVFGGSYPAIIWQKFMTSALQDSPVIEFVKPDETRWPKASFVDPDGGRGRPLSQSFTTTTSAPPPESTTTSSSSSTSSTSSTTAAPAP